MDEADPVRVDRWLWAVRLYKTRSLATTSCQGGHVRVNGAPAKPSTKVRVGDRVEARAGGIDRVVEVAALIDKRVSATIAATCVVDRTPPPPEPEWVAPPLVRDRGSGRPTKRDRRQIDQYRGR